jgi:hypothetical protein
MLQDRRSRVRFSMRSLISFNLLNPSSRTMALGSTRPLTEMSTRNILGIFLGVKGGRRIGLTTLAPSTKMWEPQRLTILWASTTCYRDTFTSLLVFTISTRRECSCCFSFCACLYCRNFNELPQRNKTVYV